MFRILWFINNLFKINYTCLVAIFFITQNKTSAVADLIVFVLIRLQNNENNFKLSMQAEYTQVKFSCICRLYLINFMLKFYGYAKSLMIQIDLKSALYLRTM